MSESTVSLVDLEVEDLGEHAVKDFPSPRRIFHLPVDGRSSDCFPPPRTLRAGRTNLPDQVSSFIGRARELVELRELLAGARVVTLTGAGGVGKTRLALRLGAEVLDGSGDGVWLVDLAPVVDPGLVGATVAGVLDVPERPGRAVLETLGEGLADRELLIVLDNCEHPDRGGWGAGFRATRAVCAGVGIGDEQGAFADRGRARLPGSVPVNAG